MTRGRVREAWLLGDQEALRMFRPSVAPTVVDDSRPTEKSHDHDNRCDDEWPGRTNTRQSQVASQVLPKPSHEPVKFPEVRVSIIMPNNMGEDQQNEKIVVNPMKYGATATQDDTCLTPAEDGEEAKIGSKTTCTGLAKSTEEDIVENQNSNGSSGSSNAESGMKCLSFKLTPTGMLSTGDEPGLKPSQSDEIEVLPEAEGKGKVEAQAPKKKETKPTEKDKPKKGAQAAKKKKGRATKKESQDAGQLSQGMYILMCPVLMPM